MANTSNTGSTGKGFKKGDAVTHIGSYDGKGTFCYYHAVVYSCGRKQMVLTDAVTGEEHGRHFAPVAATRETLINQIQTHFGPTATFPRLTDDEAMAICIEAGNAQVVCERERMNRILTINATQYAATDRQNNFYRAAIQKGLDELHEGRAYTYQK